MTRFWRRAVPAALAISLASCASLPEFIYYPYAWYKDSPRFAFEYPRLWAVKTVRGGVEFREESGRASMAIVFLHEGDPGYKPADVYRKSMYDWGSVEDSHVVSQIMVSSHTAYQVRFTTHRYDPQYLLGARSETVLTEVIMVPELDGIYVMSYLAGPRYFWKPRFRRYYRRFLTSLSLAEVKSRRYGLQQP